MRTFNFFLKRAFDIFVSTIAILFMTIIPVLIIIPIVIKLTSKGPALEIEIFECDQLLDVQDVPYPVSQIGFHTFLLCFSTVYYNGFFLSCKPKIFLLLPKYSTKKNFTAFFAPSEHIGCE